MGSKFEFVRGGTSGINSKALKDGQVLFDKEKKTISLDAMVNGTLTRIDMSGDTTFNGTSDEWEALTDAQRAAYKYVYITDDYEVISKEMAGATSSTNGTTGLVPQPIAGDNEKFLKGDGTWATVSGAFEDLSDVEIDDQTLADGDVPIYNSTTEKWENGQLSVDGKMDIDGRNSADKVAFKAVELSGWRELTLTYPRITKPAGENQIVTVFCNDPIGDFAKESLNIIKEKGFYLQVQLEGELTPTIMEVLTVNDNGFTAHLQDDDVAEIDQAPLESVTFRIRNYANVYGSVAIGGGSFASGTRSFAEGNDTTASGSYSHAEGDRTKATASNSHAEGGSTLASGMQSHAEGDGTKATNNGSHAEGLNTTSSGRYAHSEGYYTSAGYSYQHVSGKYNDNKSDTLLEVGGGAGYYDRSNAFEVYNDGSLSTDNGTTKVKLENLATKSELGTAAALNVATSGDASSTEVVKGDDSRLTDSRNAADVYSWAKAETKPSYTAAEVGAIATSAKGANGGVAELDANGKVPSSQLPSYVDDVLEYADFASFPATGETGKIYVALDTNTTYRWSGTAYVEISSSLALGETSSTAYRGDRGKTAYDHATDSSRLTTAQSSGLYKISTTAEGHVASVASVEKSDITALGIPGSDTTYGAATTSADGLMSSTDKTKLDGIESGAQVNTITGVKGSSESSYRTGNVSISPTDLGLGNVENKSSATIRGELTSSDVTTALGYTPPTQDTNTHRPIQVNGTQVLGDNTTALNLVEGTNVTITNTDGSVTISATGGGGDVSTKMDKTNPTGTGSFSLNRKSGTTVGSYSFTEGSNTTASGSRSHAEGGSTTSSGESSHAEGYATTASGYYSHAEGYITTAASNSSHAEGRYTEANTNEGAHAEGYGANSTYKIIASGKGAHAEGYTENKNQVSSGKGSHTEGFVTSSTSTGSHAEGMYTSASGDASHSEGRNTTASSHFSHAEGYYTEASTGQGAHAEGYGYSSTYKVKATGNGAHAEGVATSSKGVLASGDGSHAEGQVTTASGAYGSHAEGYDTTAEGNASHAEGFQTQASDDGAHSEGYQTYASGDGAHAEGVETQAISLRSHAEGWSTTASGNASHAEGWGTVASGDFCHASGEFTIADGTCQTVVGYYNSNKLMTLFEVGNGEDAEDEQRSNAFEVYQDASLSTDNGTNRTKLPIVKKVTLVSGSTSPTTSVSIANPGGGYDVLSYPTQSVNVTVYGIYIPVVVANGTSVSDYIASFYTSKPGLDYISITDSN